MVEVYLQDACLRHQYIRSKDLSNIVERPERLRAVNVGIATVMARTSTPEEPLTTDPNTKQEPDANDLASAIGRLNIDNDNAVSGSSAIQIHKSAAKVNILNNAAVKYVHGDTEGDVYLEKLIKLAKDSKEKIAAGDSEIPEGLSQGDLYCRSQPHEHTRATSDFEICQCARSPSTRYRALLARHVRRSTKCWTRHPLALGPLLRSAHQGTTAER